MDYRKTISYLFSLQRFGIKLGLSNITTLLKQLDNPHKKLRCIHIAGTNGKGSTAAFLHSILTDAGYRAGLFTSPHLIDFTERIKIGDREISKRRVAQLVQQIRDICRTAGLETITFFEFVTAMAFTYFAEQQADPVIVEVGMGGRLDATNVVRPLVAIITSISMEHQIYLGSTLSKIAGEKAGIIKETVPLITGATQPRIVELLGKKCKEKKSHIYIINKDIASRKAGLFLFNYRGLKNDLHGLRLGLIGDHQIRNATLALAAAELLRNAGLHISIRNMRTGILEVHWPGRLEVVRKKPVIILDGAHNPEAWKTLKKALTEYFKYKKLIMIIGIMQDKDISKMIEFLTPDAHTVIFCKPKMDRAATRVIIKNYLHRGLSSKIVWIDDTARAVDMALSSATPHDLICVTGSLFTVGEAREYLLPGRGTATGRIAL